MVTGFSTPSKGSTPAAITISSPMSRRSSPQRGRRRRGKNYYMARLLFLSIIVFSTVLLVYTWPVTPDDTSYGSYLDSASREDFEAGMPSRKVSSKLRQQQQHHQFIQPASLDSIIKYLTELARMSPDQLWDELGMEKKSSTNSNNNINYGSDPFSLRDLEAGKCPWKSSREVDTTTVDWLPPRPYNSEEIALAYRERSESIKKGKVALTDDEPYDEEKEVVIWYEHISKAGGTTFCGLADSNMQRWQVPRYHCMPRKGKLMDGRVGSWPNDELIEHVTKNWHAILSNEWDPFSLEKLELSSRQLDGTPMKNNPHPGPPLLFLTTLRDPSDRQLSAFTFFAYTTTKKTVENDDGPSFHKWIGNNVNRAKKYKLGSTQGFRANTARFNHIVWRFSGGKLAAEMAKPKEQDWKPAFDTAVRALSQHDLILPMDLMTKDDTGKVALYQMLGWDKFRAKGKGDSKEGHVVNIGTVKNSNAREYFSEDDYRSLWESNWLDHILCLWCRAVFLARLHCKDAIAEH